VKPEGQTYISFLRILGSQGINQYISSSTARRGLMAGRGRTYLAPSDLVRLWGWQSLGKALGVFGLLGLLPMDVC